jgi:polyisoprenoid-binding protein YceI
MTERRWKLLAIGVLAIVAAGAGAYIAYDQVLRGDQVAPISLPSTSTATTPPGLTSVAPGTFGPIGLAGLPGTWQIASGSMAGYRVREQLVSLSAESDAVGRTSVITGSATLVSAAGSLSVTAASFEVDMTTLVSDDNRRDGALREKGIEYDRFPTATFVLAEPISVPTAALSGAAVDVTLVGDLTLHGVSKRVEIPATAPLQGAQVQVAGSLTFPFSDFGMTKPSAGAVLSVSDDATLEFLVILVHA